ncbi:hypothetical protein HP550_10440 [Cellulomonas humilata]|uniref:DUF2029 domain-containing protein n=1 Tax=Cellulomonas humilata TaxID=144055 RepID=A0A7Y6DY64_9CELL|nr:glycosyltransferase 87 family protein [Cellulomonas humilata]NUU17664.1 hypothetical protein [Cellulomonas humilata]
MTDVVDQISGRGDRGQDVTDRSLAARWARERALLVHDRPRLARAAQWVWDRPWTSWPVAFVCFGVLGAGSTDSDAALFLEAGRSMLGPGILDVFADPALQMGPLDLVLVGGVALTADAVGISAAFLVAAVQAVLVLALAQAVAARAARRAGTDPLAVRWLVTAVLLGSGVMAEATLMGHLEELALGLLLALAAFEAADGRRWSVGVLLGLAIGTKLWAVLGMPLVLLGRRWPTAMARAVLAVAIGLGLYAPFALWGDLRTFDFAWTVSSTSTVALVAGSLATSGWALRVAQTAVVGLIGAVLALRPRVDPLAVVVAILAARLLLDPLRLPYYPGPLLVVLVLWTWTSTSRTTRRWRIPVLVASPLVALAPYALTETVQAVVGTVVLVGVLVLAVRVGLAKREVAVL